MNKKSITVVGKHVDHVYIIKDVNVDQLSLEKYSAKCVNNIQSAWEAQEQESSNNQTIEVVLQERVSNITLAARANVIDIASKNAGKIIKDFVTDRPKRSRKTYISELIFFEEIDNQ